MSVYKPKKSSVYHFDFSIKGHRYHGSTETASYEEAKAVEAAKREEARRAILFGDKKKPTMTLRVAFGRYYDEVSSHLPSKDAELTKMGKLLTLGENTPLSNITDSEIARMVAVRRGEKARYRDEPVSNATVNRETELLRRVVRRAAEIWSVDIGDEPKWAKHLLPEADERVRELTDAEEGALFAHLREDFHPLFRFALTSGMRLSNCIRLTWKHVDLAGGRIVIKVKSRKPGGKTHTLPITPAMRALLANQSGNHPIFVFTYVCEKNRNDKMGTKRMAGQRYPFSKDGWRRDWAQALEDAGIEDFRFHDLRHTAATRLVRATGNIKTAQKVLGHASLVSTARYAHVTQDDVLQALIAVDHRNFTGPSEVETPQTGRKKGDSA